MSNHQIESRETINYLERGVLKQESNKYLKRKNSISYRFRLFILYIFGTFNS